ncbi:MAG: hypothetical protein D6696_17955 [Acidobacteria bacterium]|nr:MAG: hypothetical protein D6696_17955 [Acidobacteriota bacterium]
MSDHPAIARIPAERAAPGALPSSCRVALSRLAAALFALALFALPAVLPAQEGEKDDAPSVATYAFSLQHQPASEALALVRRLLSPLGTVELQPGDNTLVVRDTKAVLARIEPLLEQFDHPPQPLRFDVHLLHADSGGTVDPGVPAEVVQRLGTYLRYDGYRLLAKAGITSREGEDVTYALGDGYNLSFRAGTVLAGQKLKLHDFRIQRKPPATGPDKSRQPEPRELIHSSLNLSREKLFTMILTREAGPAEALVVAITFDLERAPEAKR